MSFDRLHYEIKLAGRKIFLFPMLIIVVMGSFALLQRLLHEDFARSLLSEPEMFLPVVAGVLSAAIIAREPALELHLTMPRPYHQTGMLRLLVLFAWIAGLAVLCLAGLALFKLLYMPTFAQNWSPFIQFLIVQLLWLAPLLWFVAVGSCLALLTQSRAACTTLLAGTWLVNLLFTQVIASTSWLRPLLLFPATLIIYPATNVSQADFNTYWLITRCELLGTALVLLLPGWLLLHNTERLLKGATEE